MNIMLEILMLIFALIFHKKIHETMTENVESTDEAPRVQIPTVKIFTENINGIYYAWKNGVEFIGQSESPRDLARLLITKYPNTELIINERTQP